MTFSASCSHFTFEDFNQLQDFISDAIHSLQDVVQKEFKPGSKLAQYDPEKPIDHNGYCQFITAYLGENFPQSIRDKLFLSFMRRHSNLEIYNCEPNKAPTLKSKINEDNGKRIIYESRIRNNSLNATSTNAILSNLSERLSAIAHSSTILSSKSIFSTYVCHNNLQCCQSSISHQRCRTLPLNHIDSTFNVFGKKYKSNLGSAHSHPSLVTHTIQPIFPNEDTPIHHSRSSSKKSDKKIENEIVCEKSALTLSKSNNLDIVNRPLTDQDKIDMKDLLCYLSLLESGKPEDKLEFMFRLYDTDGNGVLDKSEVECIISQMMNVAGYLNWDTEELLPILQQMMNEIDYDNDGEVTLEEWKRGGMTNIPLLVLLGLDTNVRDDGKHVWKLKHFSKSTHCSLCHKILVRFGRQGLCCVFCLYTVHERCVQNAPASCIHTYTKTKKSDQLLEHHWIENHYPAKCIKCKKSTKLGAKSGFHCRWCKRTIHKCCMESWRQTCDLGDNKEHILPPICIYPSVLERKQTAKNKDCLNIEKTSESMNLADSAADEVDCQENNCGNNSNSENILPQSSNSQCFIQEQGLNHNQISSFQICALPDTKPLLVFINPKSGGKQGARIMTKFQYILNPRQVYDLVKDKGPNNGLQFFRDVKDFRILICGGDGTVGWLLEAIDKYEWNNNRPSVAILPLGTGNDLARCLRWGGGYEGEKLDKILAKIILGTVVMLDRWQITCSEPAPRPRRESKTSNGCGRTGCTGYCSRNRGVNQDSSSQNDSGIKEDSQIDCCEEGDLDSDVLSEDSIYSDEMPCNIINNYFSIGVDASIAHKFHVLREKHPEKFNSRMRNRFFYMEVGTSEVLTATCKHLHEYIDIICDGVVLDLRKGAYLEGIAILNIPSVYGGKNLWGPVISPSKIKKNQLNKPKKKKSDSGRFESRELSRESTFENLATAVQDMGDNLLEVVGLENAMHAGLVAGGFRSSGKRLAQCREVVIRTQRCFPMQIDGEPWIQAACTISITYKNQVPMIMAPPLKKFGLRNMFSR